MICIDVDKMDEADPIIIEKIRNEFYRNFCIGFTDYLYKNNKINRSECEKIKAYYEM